MLYAVALQAELISLPGGGGFRCWKIIVIMGK